MADPVTALENRKHLVKEEKERRTEGLGFTQRNKRDPIEINKHFLNFKIRQC